MEAPHASSVLALWPQAVSRLTPKASAAAVERASQSLSPALNAAKVERQMRRLLAIWDDMLAIASRVATGSMYELPIKGKIRQLRQ